MVNDMADFGDEFAGDMRNSVSRITSMLLREWWYKHRNDISNNAYKQTENEQGQKVAQFPCDTPEQQAAVVEALKAQGIDAKPVMMTPGVEVPQDQVSKIQEAVKGLDIGVVGKDLAPTAYQLDQIAKLHEEGTISTAELNELMKKDFSADKATELLLRHGHDVYFDKEGRQMPTSAQMKEIEFLHDIGGISDKDYKLIDDSFRFVDAKELIDSTPITVVEVLHHALKKDVITKNEFDACMDMAQSGEFERNRFAGLVSKKLTDAGYDMNDLTKNDARMRPSHDGMDPDAHTQAVEGSWKDEIRDRLSEIIKPGMTDREFMEAASRHGITVTHTSDKKDFLFQLDSTALTHPGNRVAGATLGHEFSRSAFKLTKDPFSRSLPLQTEMNHDLKEAKKGIEAPASEERTIPHAPQNR